MEPITINVNVTLSLSEKAESLLRAFIPDAPASLFPLPGENAPKKPSDEPKPQVEQPSVREEKAPQAAPQAPAAAENKTISDSDLRQAVKEAKDRSSAKAVREVFAAFDIGSSVECPQERRSELLAALENVK